MPVTTKQRTDYFKKRSAGWTIGEASRAAGFSPRTGSRLEGDVTLVNQAGKETREKRRLGKLGGAKTPAQLCPEARAALDDFALFQRRYFGRIALPWQIEAANTAIKLLESPEKEYVVINCPRGCGKSTLFTHDIPVWITVKHRDTTRGLIVSNTQTIANNLLKRVRETLERVGPQPANWEEIAKGREVEPVASLAHDYGRFKPTEQHTQWSQSAITVEQPGGVASTDKENTWTAYGFSANFLGSRHNVILCDDVQAPDRISAPQQFNEDRQKFNDVCEYGLEPGGLLLLQGQRLGANDIYGYAKSLKMPIDEEEDWDEDMPAEERSDEDEAGGWKPKYHQIIYKAHYEELCKGTDKGCHNKLEPWPASCLLDPKRLRWRDLAAGMKNGRDRFRVLMQQEDTDPEGVLVNPMYVTGDGGFPGCLDRERDIGELPEFRPDGTPLDKRKCLSMVTLDPSVSNYWAMQWWVVDPVTELRYLVRLERRAMQAPDFLEFNLTEKKFTGFLELWYQYSVALGCPISVVIVEAVAAQHYLLQYDFVHKWQVLRGVRIIPHTTTGKNKLDENFGVWTIAQPWEAGKVRVPWAGKGRLSSIKLVYEVTHYPDAETDDCVMSQWFGEYHLPELLRRAVRDEQQKTTKPMPEWLAADVNTWRGITGIAPKPVRQTRVQQIMAGARNG